MKASARNDKLRLGKMLLSGSSYLRPSRGADAAPFAHLNISLPDAFNIATVINPGNEAAGLYAARKESFGGRFTGVRNVLTGRFKDVEYQRVTGFSESRRAVRSAV